MKPESQASNPKPYTLSPKPYTLYPKACAPKLATDAAGVARYDGVAFMTSKGPCTSVLTGAAIK